MWKNAKPYVLSIGIALAVGGLSALLSRNGMAAYRDLTRPVLSPPGFLFPVVWTVLFVLMGTGAALVWRAGRTESRAALRLYAAQLLVNFFWPIFFFSLGWRLFAFLWLLLLLALVGQMIRRFYAIRPLAAYLQVPYLLWLCFAAYLNVGIWLLNG